MSERETEQRVLAWLGFWRDDMPRDAVRQLQDILGVEPPPRHSIPASTWTKESNVGH